MSANREAFEAVYQPGNNSPRLKETRNSPGPGEYKYKNMCVGVDAKKFQFLRRTKNIQGTSKPLSISFKSTKSYTRLSWLRSKDSRPSS